MVERAWRGIINLRGRRSDATPGLHQLRGVEGRAGPANRNGGTGHQVREGASIVETDWRELLKSIDEAKTSTLAQILGWL